MPQEGPFYSLRGIPIPEERPYLNLITYLTAGLGKIKVSGPPGNP